MQSPNSTVRELQHARLRIHGRSAFVLAFCVAPFAWAGSVASFAKQQVFAVGNGPAFAAVADINGDGKTDVIIANQGDNSVSVLFNTTTAGTSVASLGEQVTFATGPMPTAVAIADVNGDGKADLIVANYSGDLAAGISGNSISVLLNTTAPGASLPSFAAQRVFAAGTNPVQLPSPISTATANLTWPRRI